MQVNNIRPGKAFKVEAQALVLTDESPTQPHPSVSGCFVIIGWECKVVDIVESF